MIRIAIQAKGRIGGDAMAVPANLRPVRGRPIQRHGSGEAKRAQNAQTSQSDSHLAPFQLGKVRNATNVPPPFLSMLFLRRALWRPMRPAPGEAKPLRVWEEGFKGGQEEVRRQQKSPRPGRSGAFVTRGRFTRRGRIRQRICRSGVRSSRVPRGGRGCLRQVCR